MRYLYERLVTDIVCSTLPNRRFSLTIGINIHLSDIIKYTNLELLNNADEYCDFIVGSQEPLTTLIGKYINNKVWYNDFCNIIPLAISNAFSIKIVILTPDRVPTFYEIIRRNNEVDSPYRRLGFKTSYLQKCYYRENRILVYFSFFTNNCFSYNYK